VLPNSGQRCTDGQAHHRVESLADELAVRRERAALLVAGDPSTSAPTSAP